MNNIDKSDLFDQGYESMGQMWMSFHRSTSGQFRIDNAIHGQRFIVAILLVIACACACHSDAFAQDGFVDRAPKIKAAYLFQFIRYVKWPEDTFAGTDTPLVIGTVGDDEVNDFLRAIARTRTAGNRKLVYRQVSSIEQVKSCHILFFSDSVDEAMVKALILGADELPVLLVGESADFVRKGGVITFNIAENKIRIQLSIKSATNHNLTISSQLAKVATVVD